MNSAQACMLVNQSSRPEGSLIWLGPGLLMLVIGLKLMWRYMGRSDVPALWRFSNALIAGVLILLA
ncbi:MAG: hypothetical protein KDK39_05575 [Leptospiraceae bacterium]|nr:hypothetical protein [Leptospiraceae bacterium]